MAVRHVAALIGQAERDDPAGIGVARVGDHGEPEVGRQALADLLPGLRAVVGAIDPIVVPLVERVGLAGGHRELPHHQRMRVAHFFLEVLDDLGRTAESQQLSEKMAKIEPYPPFYYFDLGLKAMQQGDYKRAKALFSP